MGRHSVRRAVAHALVILGVASCHRCRCHRWSEARAEAPGNDAQHCTLVEQGFGPEGAVPVVAEEVASGLEVPWGILFLENGDLLVTERPGRLRLVRDGRLAEQPVAEVEVLARGEGGLLGIQAHPELAVNRRFYLYMTVQKNGRVVNRIELWRLDAGDPPRASRVEVVVDDIPAAAIHNGGRLRLGPDGRLYAGTGDAGEPRRAQSFDTLAGKLLRLELHGGVPADNPYSGTPIYLLGIRDSQGFDWRADGALLVTDHGPSGELGRTGHDEVSVAQAGDNLGWPTIYGCRERPEMVAPSLTWDRAVPPGGATVYTGDAIPEWTGSLLVGTLGSRHLHRVVLAEDGRRVLRHEVYFQGDPPGGLGRLRETVMGPDGHLYVTTSNCDGRGTCPPERDKVLRIVPRR